MCLVNLLWAVSVAAFVIVAAAQVEETDNDNENENKISIEEEPFDDKLLEEAGLKLMVPLKNSKVLRTAYYVSKFNADWDTAGKYCADVNMKLVAIEDVYEDSDIVGYLKTQDILRAWTSGNDLALNGRYTWSATGKPFHYSNWHKSEIPRDERRACVFTATDKFWNDGTYGWDEDYCATKHHFICEEQL